MRSTCVICGCEDYSIKMIFPEQGPTHISYGRCTEMLLKRAWAAEDENAALRERIDELETQPRIHWHRYDDEPDEPERGDVWIEPMYLVVESGRYREITTARFQNGEWFNGFGELLDITHWARVSGLRPDPL